MSAGQLQRYKAWPPSTFSVKIPLADQKVLAILDMTQKIHDHPDHFLLEQPTTIEYCN